jgi:ATP-binding cassette subfamily C exporter for protease/lipase
MRRNFLAVAGFSFVINLLMLVPAVYMLQIYDRVLASRSEVTLLMITLIVLALYLLLGGMEWIRSQLLVRSSRQLDERLKDRVFAATFEGALRGMTGNPAQALLDLASVRQFLGGNGLFAFFDAPWVPIFLAVIALLHPMLGLLSLVGGLILVVLTYLTERLTAKPLAESNAAAIQATNLAGNNLRNAEVAEAMGMLGHLRERWRKRHDQSLELQELASDRAGMIGAITRFARISLQSLILGAGALYVIQDQLSPGSMIAASILMGRALSPIEQAIGAWRNFVAARTAYERLSRLLETFPARAAGMALPRPRGRVSVEAAAAVAPNTQRAILRGVNFAIEPGEILGVIGPSGSGKSSLARLLVGVWPAVSGSVRLDGAEVYAWDKRELGPHVGYLPQDVELFEGSVAENIARFAEVESDKVVRAAQRAGVHELVLQFPKGYDTEVGRGGGALSGGQRQRIALARAVYGDPVLIVLDEPNSNLDESGEAALVGAVRDLKSKGSAIVVISHRVNILGVVDKLLLLRDGAVQLFGPRADVLDALAKAAAQAKAASAAARASALPARGASS